MVYADPGNHVRENAYLLHSRDSLVKETIKKEIETFPSISTHVISSLSDGLYLRTDPSMQLN